MMRTWRNRQPEPQASSRGGNAVESLEAAQVRVCPTDSACRAIHLDSCLPFERIAVRTRRTDYEVVVLPGSAGQVLVRGGQYFNEFRRAGLAGSSFGGSAIKVRTIEVGCRLELQVDGTPIVTSTIQAVSRVKDDATDLVERCHATSKKLSWRSAFVRCLPTVLMLGRPPHKTETVIARHE